MLRIAFGVTLLAAIACADAATLRVTHPYGEVIDRGVASAAIQASYPDRIDCTIAPAVTIAGSTVTITARRLDPGAPPGTCPAEVAVPIGQLARGAWRVQLRVIDTFGIGLVESAFLEVRVHAPDSTCRRYPTGRAVVEARHRTLDGQRLRDRIASDPVFAARVGNPFDVMLILALDPAVAMLRYDWLDNPHDKRALLERTGEFDRLYAYDGGACLATPPPDLFASMIEYRHAVLDHYFYTANPSEIAGLDDGTGARGWTRTGRSFRVLREPGVPVRAPRAGRAFASSASPAWARARTCSPSTARSAASLPTAARGSTRAWPFWATPPDSTGGCSHPGEIPLYRVWKSFGDSNHRFTTERAVVEEMKAKGWVDEGIAMCVRGS